ncbi:S13-like H2TH domain-containing protein [Serendipita vermifera]|nr:S13-like H2TH domain-containing protein [Serendipita vermifera]
MVYVMGVALSDTYPAKIALTGIYGIGRTLARQICARLQIHENATLPSLTPQQMTALTAFLSAPANAQMLPKLQLAGPYYKPSFQTNLINTGTEKAQSVEASKSVALKQNPKALMGYGDRLRQLRIETDLRRYVRENIMHHRIINSYIGRRHAMGLPVRGQRTNTNGMTARRLNKIERRG